MTELTIADVANTLPFLKDAEDEIKQEFAKQAVLKDVPPGEIIGWEGDTCSYLAFVLSGTVRVYKVGENGREITLYRLEDRESCILTASCILSQTRFPAMAVVETPVKAILVSAPVVRAWMERYEVWRDYIFELMSRRLAEVITTVEEVAFRRVDVRVAKLLVKLQETGRPIRITHQEIAFELGTAREVVSRILKDFEREELITLTRGAIIIHNPPALREKTNLAQVM